MNSNNIDKIAIGVAALIIVGIIGVTLFSSDEVATAVDSIQEYNEKIEENTSNQKLPSATAKAALDEIKPGFSGLDEDEQFAAWAVYRKPGSAVVTVEIPDLPPVHEGPKLTLIQQVRDRDLKKPIHVIQGVRAKVERASVTKQVVQRREAGTEEWNDLAPVPDGSGTFEVRSEDVEQGKTYDYRVVSVAESGSKLPFTGGDDTLESGEYSAEVPFDEVWEFTSARAPDFVKGLPGECFLHLKRWNYDKLDDDNPDTWRDSFKGVLKIADLPNQPKIFETNWQLRRVDQDKHPADGKTEMMVELRDREASEKLILWKRDNDTKSLEASDVTGDSVEEEAAEPGDNTASEEASDPVPDEPKKPVVDDDDF